MAMPIAVPRYTVRELDAFPDDGNRYELLDGVLLVTPQPIPLHQIVVGRIQYRLMHYLADHPGIAEAVAPGAVEIEPGHHLEPDILVMPAGAIPRLTLDTRWSAIRSWWLAVEVSGRSSRIYDRDFKMRAYLAMGVRSVWRADLRDHCIYTASTSDPAEHRVDRLLTWHPTEMPIPLTLDVPGVFDGVTGDP